MRRFYTGAVLAVFGNLVRAYLLDVDLVVAGFDERQDFRAVLDNIAQLSALTGLEAPSTRPEPLFARTAT